MRNNHDNVISFNSRFVNWLYRIWSAIWSYRTLVYLCYAAETLLVSVLVLALLYCFIWLVAQTTLGLVVLVLIYVFAYYTLLTMLALGVGFVLYVVILHLFKFIVNMWKFASTNVINVN